MAACQQVEMPVMEECVSKIFKKLNLIVYLILRDDQLHYVVQETIGGKLGLTRYNRIECALCEATVDKY